MRIRVAFAVALLAVACLASADQTPMPWTFVNGSAKGYSIKLESASPTPGTPITVGQAVEFKIAVLYQLSIADKGGILMVVQDETDKNLLSDKKQPTQSVDRGKGAVTLTGSLVVPAGSDEVRLFIPLVPSGISHTSGELVIRYPVRSAGAWGNAGGGDHAGTPGVCGCGGGAGVDQENGAGEENWRSWLFARWGVGVVSAAACGV
jgi:hypothetical protein